MTDSETVTTERVLSTDPVVAFVGDIHDDDEFIEHIRKSLEKRSVQAVCLLGDITTSDTLRKFEGYNLNIVFGDADNVEMLCQTAADMESTTVFGLAGPVSFGRKSFMLRHGIGHRELSYGLASTHYDYVVHGHYHTSEFTEVGSGAVVSPGSEGIAYYHIDSDSFEQIEFDVVTNP